MSFPIKSCIQAYCLCIFLLLTTFVVQGKEKIETPHKPSEGKNSIPALRVPWVYRNHPLLSKPALPLSLDPIRFTLHTSKQTISAGEEVEITITAQLLDIPSSAFFIFEDQKSFSLKLLLPQGFTQTGGDYQEFIGGKLSTPNSIFIKRIRGVFASVPENPCFILLRGAYNANSSSVFEQKQTLCLDKKITPKATREADCVSPWIAVQNKTCGSSTYSLNVSVSQDALLTTNVGQVSGTAPNYTITNVPLSSELVLTATNCDKQVSLVMPVAPCQNCNPPTIVVGAPNCGSTTYSFGVDMFDGVTLNSNYGTIVGTAPHFAINDISLGQTITLTATAANGCQSTIIVSGSSCGTGGGNNNGGSCTPPVLAPITPQTICYGGAFYMVNTSVTNGVETYYQWYNDNGVANNNTNPIEGENRANLRSFPTTPGEYKYKVVATSSANSACTASQSVTLTIQAPPTVTSTTGTNPSCVPSYGGAISVAGAGGTSFLYSKDNGGNWVDLTGANAQNEITRNAMLYAPQNDVARVKITLEEGFGLGPGGEYTGQILNQSSAPTFEGLAAGTYNIRVKAENGCISAPTAVTLTNPNAPAIFNVTGGGACLPYGAPINLSGSVVGVNYYLLRNGITVSGTVAGTGGALYFANHSTDGTYTVVASNASNGCSAQMNNSVVVSSGTPPAAPTNSEGDKIYCAGKPNLLGVSVGAGQTADWYSSATGGTPLSGGTGVVSFVPPTTGVYYVETRDITTQCKSTTRTPVTLHAAPTLSITGSSSIGCESPTALLTAATSSNLPSNIPISYAWKMGSNSTIVATTPTFSAAQTGTYTVSLSYEGCTLSSSKTVSNLDPEITLASTANLACIGDLSLTPTITNTNANTSYEWSGPDGFTATTSSVNVSKSGTYTILVKKNGTIPCGAKEIFVGDRPQTPEAPELIATELSIDPENASTLIARGCPTTVRWSYISNDPIEPSTAPINQDPQTATTSVSIVESVTTPELPLSFQTTSFQTSATYTASCMGACGLSTSSLPITIFKNICGIKIEADKKAVTPNTPVTLVVLSCEPANITWSTGQTGTRTIIVSPSTTTTYFAVCQLPTTGKSCSSSVEIKVSSSECLSNFTITASSTSIQKGDVVTLTASGCTGSLAWSNGVQESTSIKVFPTSDMSFFATCTQNEKVCYSNTILIQTQKTSCLTALYSSGIRFNKDHWSTSILPSGCENGTLVYSHQGMVKQAYKSGSAYLLNEVTGSITVTAVCTMPDGTTCGKTLTITSPSKDCNNLTLSVDAQNRISASNGEPFLLTDETGNPLNQTAYTSLKVPVSVKDRFYTATFGNGCKASIKVPAFNFTIYWKTNQRIDGDMFDVSNYTNDPSSTFKIIMEPLDNNCTGQIIWTNDQDPAFRYEGSTLVFQNSYIVSGGIGLGLPFLPMPAVTTTYYASCYRNGVSYPATNAKTLVVNTLGGCLTVTRDAWQITHGNPINLKASGCLGQTTWTFNGSTVGTGNTLTHTPTLSSTPNNATYTATCTNPACSQSVAIRVQPCQFSISSPKNPVKIAEPLLLSAKGCSGGVVVWNTGETGNNITVKPLTATTYSATCVVNTQTLCQSNSLAISIDNQAPADIDCPQLTISTIPVLRNIYKCNSSKVDITAHCPTGSQIIWGDVNDPNSVKTLPGETRSFNLSQTTVFTVTCVDKYKQSDQQTFPITAVDEPISIYPTQVNAGEQVILTASGCRGIDCQELVYIWQEKNSNNQSVMGKTNRVVLLQTTTYVITCSNGTSKEVTVYANENPISCELNVKRGGGCEGGTHRLAIYSIKTCNPSYPIYWYRGVWSSAIQDYSDYRLTYSNVTVVTEPLSAPTAYKVICTNSDGKQCISFAEPPSGAEFCNGISINISIGGKNIEINPNNPGSYGATNPSECDKLVNEAKGKYIATPRGPQYAEYYLTSDWCKGTKVIWYTDKGVKLKQLTPPSGEYQIGELSRVVTYQYECYLSDGEGSSICDGTYKIGPSSGQIGGGGRIGTNTTTQIASGEVQNENICSSSLPLSTPLAVELASLICTHVELLKNPDGSMSSAKVGAFLAALKTSVITRYAASGITVSFPADDAAVIAAIMAQNCTQAGQLLAAPNTATVTPTQFNTVKNATHPLILQDLKPVLISECSTPQLPPTIETFSTISNGRVAALDPNRYFIAPDGRAVKLPVGATPEFFSFQIPYFTPPKGTLQGIKTSDGKRYFADIAIGSGTFFGYRLLETPLSCPGVYLDNVVSLYASVASQPAVNVYYIKDYKANGQCGYEFIASQYSFVPTPKTIIDLAPLTGTTAERWTKVCPTEEIYDYYGNQFKLTTTNGSITKVQGTWQTFGKCPTCPSIAEQALQNALAKVTGTLTTQTIVVPTTTKTYGTAGSIVYSQMKLLDLLKNLSKTYNSLVDKAKVPEAVWQPQEDLPAEDKNFFVQDGTGVISGSLDGVAGELTDKAQLVGLGLKLVSDPEGAWNSLVSFKNSLDWGKAGIIAKTMAQGIVGYDATEFEKGGIYSKHATGKVAGTITFD